MDYNNISQLLEKYWEGETSLQEENTLKHYFNYEKVADELQEYQPLFQFFKEEQDIKISDDFEKRLLAEIENEQNVTPAKIRKLTWRTSIRAIAAVGIVLLCAVFLFKNFAPNTNDIYANHPNVEVIDDEIEAYKATKAALLLLSGKMKKGSKKATKGLREVKSATKNALK